MDTHRIIHDAISNGYHLSEVLSMSDYELMQLELDLDLNATRRGDEG